MLAHLQKTQQVFQDSLSYDVSFGNRHKPALKRGCSIATHIEIVQCVQMLFLREPQNMTEGIRTEKHDTKRNKNSRKCFLLGGFLESSTCFSPCCAGE